MPIEDANDQGRDGRARRTQKSKPSYWFWGTIFTIGGVIISLTVVATIRANIVADFNPGSSSSSYGERSPEWLDETLGDANFEALQAAGASIEPLLEDVYAPVYAAIPAYTDFHYSIWGSYVELGRAALGDPAEKLQEMLFGGLEDRLLDVTRKVEAGYSDAFQRQLNEPFTEAGKDREALGPLTAAVIADAKRQTAMSGALFVGAAGSTTVLASVVAKKLGAKIAAKVALKAGSKWGMVFGGAGGGAALCAWAGPGAAACAVGGGIAVWLISDYAVTELDQLMNRDEFEADLRSIIDEDKVERRMAIESALVDMAHATQTNSEILVQDFTIKQLSGRASAAVCEIARSFEDKYNALNRDLRARRPSELSAYHTALSAEAANYALSGLVKEILSNIDVNASKLQIIKIAIQGQLPSEFRAERRLSGILTIDETRIDLKRMSVAADELFVLNILPESDLLTSGATEITLSLEQHLRVKSHRFFGGAAKLDLFNGMSARRGLERKIAFDMPLAIDADANDVLSVAPADRSYDTVSVEMSLLGQALPNLNMQPDCATEP